MEERKGSEGIMIRKLTPKEHGKTRKLWEEVFAEDSEAFLDYYYSEITRQNEIYVVEGIPEEMTEKRCTGPENRRPEIHAMLHLNPFTVKAGAYCGKADYIVAVATQKPYRGRGYMAELLKAACQDMFRERLPFTFLMPAAEAIYYPHGFRFIYRQNRGWITARNIRPEIVCEPMAEKDWPAAAALAEQLLKGRDVYTKRSERYYRRLEKEQRSENGGVLLLREAGRLKGILCYASDGDTVEIREPLLDTPPAEWDQWLSRAAYVLKGEAGSRVRCEGYGKEERKPVIMARVVCLPAFFACFRAKENLDGWITAADSLLEENTGEWHISASKGEPVRAVRADADKEEATGVVRAAQLADEEEGSPVPVSVLMACLSGDKSIEEAAAAEDVILAEEVKALLHNIQPWGSVFINEIV